MTKRMILLALVSALMLVIAACDELEAERVSDDSGDDTPVEQPAPDPDDDSDDASISDDENGAGDQADDAVADVESTVDEAVNDSAGEEAADDGTTDDLDDGELEEAEGFTVGDRVRMGDLVMHLHAVRWGEGSEFFGPDEGMRWLIADIEIENESDSSTRISSLLMFDLVDQDNRTRDIAFMADTEGSVDGELGAGRSMRGDLAWEVREGQTEWELIFTPQLFGFGQAIFDITEADFN
jgi:hypothetical protein